MEILSKFRSKIFDFGLKTVYAFIYFGQWNKKTIIYRVSDFVNFKIRVWTSDKLILWEVWKQREHTNDSFDIGSSDVVIDVGAHTGAFSIYAAKKAVHGKVYAHEAYKENYELLIENIRLNDLKNIVPFNVAVLSKPGIMDFFIGEKNTSASSIFKNRWAKKNVKVNAISLEDVFANNKLKKINFLKIDAEGAEYDIILNAPPGLLKKVDKISLEFHDNFPHGHNYKEMVECLEKNGFNVEVNTSLFFKRFFKMGLLKAWRNHHQVI